MGIVREEAANVMAADGAQRAERRARSAVPLASAHRDRIRRMEDSGRTAIVRAPAAVSAADVPKANRAALDANAAAERRADGPIYESTNL